VPKGASREEVRRAYRALVRRHHPDANPGDPNAEERFKEIQRAYEALTKPAVRRPQGPASSGNPRGGRATPRPGSGRGVRAESLRDLLDKLGASGDAGSTRERVLRLLGDNLKVEVKYSFGEGEGRRKDGEGRAGDRKRGDGE